MIRDFNGLARLRRLGFAASSSLLLAYSGCSADDSGGASGSAGTAGTAPDGSAGMPAEVAGSGPDDGAAAAGAGGGAAEPAPDFFGLGSVVINADGARTTYLQTIQSLDDGPFDNSKAIEMPGNGTLLASGDSVFAGLAEEPTWVRYTADATGKLSETGRLSFLDYGVSYVDYGNAMIDDELAVSVLSIPALAVIWNTKTMEIEREVDLKHLVVPAYELEVWTTIAHDGLVYVPGRWADWTAGKIRGGVSLTIIDPIEGKIVGVAEDERCASGGRVVFAPDGYAYVMGDGRNFSAQMYANAAGESTPENCLLRIAPGETDFEEDFFYTIPSLTGGLESITELETGQQGSGLAFAKMFDPSQLPEGVEPVDFTFWEYPSHKTWRLELTDPPVAKPVDGMPYSAIGFGGNAFRGKLYTGESLDQGATSDVYEVDPEQNHGDLRFKMDGYFYGLYELTVK